MTKEFIPYQQALDLKELGFDEPCLAQYRKYDVGEATLDIGFSKNEIISKFDNLVLFCSAPLYQQAFRWFREKHNLYAIIIPTVTMAWTFKTMTVTQGMIEVPPYSHVDAYDYSRREEAELACLIKLIEIVKDEKSKSNS